MQFGKFSGQSDSDECKKKIIIEQVIHSGRHGHLAARSRRFSRFYYSVYRKKRPDNLFLLILYRCVSHPC